jgi:ABC-2 type transport system permease protein
MSIASIPYIAAQPSQPFARPVGALVRIFAKETKYEFLRLLRTKQFSLATIGFPVMFYTLFGLSNHKAVYGNFQVAKYLMGGYACFGLVGAALFGIGVGMAAEINAGWLEVKRASPMPPLAYLFAKCVTAIAFGLIIVSILIGLGTSFGGVSVTGSEIVRMWGVSIAGSVAFASMGLLLAQLVSPSAAPGIVNLFYLPMSFLSGLWIPVRELPHWVQKIAPVLPTYHLAQLMVGIFGSQYGDHSSAASHWRGLGEFTCIMIGAAWAVFHRTQRQA